MKKLAVFCFLLITLSACQNKVDELLLSNDVELKEQKAKEYFERGDYENASPIFKDLIQSYSSSYKVEKVYFYYSYCDYLLKDYLLAAFEFKKIIKKFPRGQYTERAQFLLADCYFNATPKHNLDQQYNEQGIEEFQLFLEKYPGSEYTDEANKKIDQLIEKKERKDYENAKLYYKKGDYKSSMKSFEYVLEDFPDTKREKELRYLIVSSAYLYAEKSIESKQDERYKACIMKANDFSKKYDNDTSSVFAKENAELRRKSQERIKELKKSLPVYFIKKKKFEEAKTHYWGLYGRSKTAEGREEYSLLYLDACYQKVLFQDDEEKLKACKEFKAEYEKVKSNISAEKRTELASRLNYVDGVIIKLSTELPYDLMAKGEYEAAHDFFQKTADTADFKNEGNFKLFVNYLKSKHSLAEKSKEVKAMQLWQGVLDLCSANNNVLNDKKYGAEVQRLEQKAKDKLSYYPLALIKAPLKRKDYSLAIRRANAEIKKGESGKDREEIVYLLLLSSVKKATKSKKYERLPHFEQAKRELDQYGQEMQGSKYEGKTADLLEKVNKGLEKYRHE